MAFQKGESGGSKALAKAKGGAVAARKTIARIRDDKEAITNSGLGLAAGYVGAKYWGKQIAKRTAAGQSITVMKSNVTYGKALGGASALAGAFNMLGDDRSNQVALVGGAMVLGADLGVAGYLEELGRASAAAA